MLVAVVCGALLAMAAGATATTRDSLHITSISPSTGKYGTVYKLVLTGHVAHATQLALSMTSSPGDKCNASYAKGFATQGGIGNASGNPLAPINVHVGKLSKTIHSKITISQPGTYGICAYLQRGSVTKAHAASSFTITQ